jgi:alpha-tubulin suppressor-like RCC1 family protein
VLNDVGQSTWETVSVGSDHSCGIKSSGALYCWGSNAYGQLGIAQSDTVCGPTQAQSPCDVVPRRVQPNLSFQSVSAGAHHTCAITTGRDAYCWGANDQGQLGTPNGGGATAVLEPTTLGWTQISAGFSHTCGVRTDGALFCWGSNDRGQLGDGSFVGNDGMIRVPSATHIASVATGESRTCARTTAGAVSCWGAIWTDRENGLEITRADPSPEPVPAAPSMAWLSVGSFTTCGADLSGVAYCWEANPRGEMGDGTEEGSTIPIAVSANLTFIQVTAGIVQSCGVTESGAGYCWGDDTFGQLGVLPTNLLEQCGGQQLYCSTTPIAVFGSQRFTEISTGFGSHTCGVTTQGNLYCWGLGVSGQRGDGTSSTAIATPTQVVDPSQ